MLYAEYKGDEVWASEFPNEIADINTCKDGLENYPKCPECGTRVTHRSQSSDGKPANFAHCNWKGHGGGGGGGGDCSGVSVGESQEHKAMKDIATSAVAFALKDIGIEETHLEVELAANYSDADWRTADCLIEFETRDRQLGEGLIIEVQYQNKTKDKEQVTLDYLNVEQDYSVLWLSHQDFERSADHPKNWSCRLIDEFTVRQRVRKQLWPVSENHTIWSVSTDNFSPAWTEYPQKALLSSQNATVHKTAEIAIDKVRRTGDNSNIPKPKVAGTAIDEIAKDYAKKQDWSSLFRAEQAQKYIGKVASYGESSSLPKPKIAGTVIDEIAVDYKKSKKWDELFDEPQTDEFIREVQIKGSKAVLKICPYCQYLHDIRDIKPGEISRGKTCRSCGRWFTVFNRDKWIRGAQHRDRQDWQEVIANV